MIGTALAYGGLMLTSNLVALIFTPLLAIYALILLLNRLNEEQPIRQWSRESFFPLIANTIRVSAAPLLGLLLGLLISAFFWLPALAEGSLVNQEQWYGGYYNPELHFVYPHQLFAPGWGFGISEPGPDDIAAGRAELPTGRGTGGAVDPGVDRDAQNPAGAAAGAQIPLAVAVAGDLPDVARIRVGVAQHRLCQLRTVPVALVDAGRVAAGGVERQRSVAEQTGGRLRRGR